MKNSRSHKALKTFIQDTLGCGCPVKVFEKINVDKHRVQGYPGGLTRIVVGNTLLIYIAHAAEKESWEESVEAIGLAGKVDRDQNKYNRFRLVVAQAGNGFQSDSISDKFSRAFGSDAKMHIHFVSEELVKGLGF